MRHFLKIPNEEKQVNSEEVFWMVYRDDSLYSRVKHTSSLTATCEAERLAKKNPNEKFYVLKAQSVSVVAPVVTTNL